MPQWWGGVPLLGQDTAERLLPTRIARGHRPPLLKGLYCFSTRTKATRSGSAIWTNIYFLFNCPSTSHKFVPGSSVPEVLQGLYFISSFWVAPYSLLAFHLDILLVLPSCIWRLKESEKTISSRRWDLSLIDAPSQNVMKTSSFSTDRILLGRYHKGKRSPSDCLVPLEKGTVTNKNHI